MALRFRLLWFVCLLSISLSAQSFGIRAGLNYTQFSGPLEEGVGEKFSLANGFHFGVNYAYPIAEDLAVRGELVYTQVGTGYSYDGESFYKIPIGNAFVYEKGRSTIKMKISNAYVSLPISLSWQVNKKWELSAGAYVSFLIGPRGNGTLYFEKNTDSLFFKQSLIHNYYNDAAGGVATGSTGPSVWVDGKIVTLARDAGAYYNYLSTEKVGNMYNFLDLGLTGSVNYFINKGFFVGFKYSYGLLDVTNNGMDVLRKQYDETINRAIPANHFDRNTGFEVSFGFRF